MKKVKNIYGYIPSQNHMYYLGPHLCKCNKILHPKYTHAVVTPGAEDRMNNKRNE